MEGKQRLKRALSAHQPRPIGDFRRYAVLIPLVYENGTPYLLFEKRSKLISQPGETAFPGGKIEPGETAVMAAVRETREELGLPENKIQVYGPWNPLITWHNMMIETVTGELRDFCASRFAPNEEVEELFCVPLSFFMEKEPRRYFSRLQVEQPDDFPYELLPNERGYRFRTGKQETLFWVYEKRVIWGLTARITKDFTDYCKEIL
ncbi:MAG: CoA pyrophosphatase [Tissierellia bacterium]|nr:CoA pyrophosphatase [Bacillota bacterium]NLK57900.1 CoA pyrophosphatase [Tissierellia bacterium]